MYDSGTIIFSCMIVSLQQFIGYSSGSAILALVPVEVCTHDFCSGKLCIHLSVLLRAVVGFSLVRTEWRLLSAYMPD